jgi:hypothetical protein
MIERDVIHAESCYQEDGEEVRRQEARQEVSPQGRRQEGDAQRRGEEGLCEKELRPKVGGEEIRRQKGRCQEVGRQTGAGEAQENDSNARLGIVGAVAGRLIGFTRSGVSADQARLLAVRPRLISLFVLRVRIGMRFSSPEDGRLATLAREAQVLDGKPAGLRLANRNGAGRRRDLAMVSNIRPLRTN